MTATDLSINAHSDDRSADLPVLDSLLDDSFAKIDWQAPWLGHLNQLSYISKTIIKLSVLNTEFAPIETIENTPDIIATILNTALHHKAESLKQPIAQTKPTLNNQAQTLSFVSQNALPEGEAYESFIATTGNIPTRDNLHDLFNGSIWLTFPKTKALLNYYHMCEIAQRGISASRGRVRDTITVFDENGAILVTAEPRIGAALIDFDWQASLVTPRASWDNSQPLSTDDKHNAKAAVYIFGHALLEKLLQPRKPLCAHSVILHVSNEFFTLALPERMQYVDNNLAEYMDKLLAQNEVTPRKLSPLPILGVPHFWAENVNPSFYDDNKVFRDGRRKK